MKRNNSFGDRRLIKIREELHLKEFHNKKQKSEEATHKQQILILHYLGILDQFNITTVKKGRLFSQLLNRNDKNTEDYIRYVGERVEKNNLKSDKNLEYVYDLFEEIGLISQAEKVKRDIDKIK